MRALRIRATSRQRTSRFSSVWPKPTLRRIKIIRFSCVKRGCHGICTRAFTLASRSIPSPKTSGPSIYTTTKSPFTRTSFTLAAKIIWPSSSFPKRSWSCFKASFHRRSGRSGSSQAPRPGPRTEFTRSPTRKPRNAPIRAKKLATSCGNEIVFFLKKCMRVRWTVTKFTCI